MKLRHCIESPTYCAVQRGPNGERSRRGLRWERRERGLSEGAEEEQNRDEDDTNDSPRSSEKLNPKPGANAERETKTPKNPGGLQLGEERQGTGRGAPKP